MMERKERKGRAVPLFFQDGEEAGIFFCSECRAVSSASEQAQRCHGVLLCKCGKPVDSAYATECVECDRRSRKVRMDKEEFARYEKATKVKQGDWGGDQVFWDDRYFETVEEAVEHAESGGMPTPEYIWAATNIGVQRADIEDVLTPILDGMWEGAQGDDLEGVVDLENAIERFNSANKGVLVWMVDYSTAILVDEQAVKVSNEAKSAASTAEPGPVSLAD